MLVLWCLRCGAGAVVLVLVLVPWGWSCGAGAVVLVVSRTPRKGIGAPALGTLPMSPAQAHKHRVVGSCDSQLVVLGFARKLAD